MTAGFPLVRTLAAAGLTALALAACRGDRAPPPPPPPAAPAGSVAVTLEVPQLPGWNDLDTLGVTVTNGTPAPLADAVLELYVQAPVRLLVDSAGSAVPAVEVTAEGTRLTFPLGTLAPGGKLEVQQGLRTPPAPAPSPAAAKGAPAPRTRGFTATLADTSSRFLVRATVASRGGTPLVPPVQDTLRIRAGSEVAVGGCGSSGDVVVTRYGVGPVRVGMTETALRSACPEARDTAWTAEGTKQTGLVVLPGGRRVLAATGGGAVRRIVIDDPAVKTPTGFGAGSAVAELRASYGRMCAGMGEGRVAVWFPNAPGLSFALDSLATRGWPPARVHPDSIPDETKITSLWVRQGSDDCPAPPGEGGR
ncbi:MAG TPA: hypothetical protein VGO40_05215 [Longimicrobium sp.]|jgi:hypothetical protein|nr:hypothetical protein [Longimicrobium sp.]